jgi:predicted metal-dependent peptidase
MILNTPTKYKGFEERWDWILAYMTLDDCFVHSILMIMTKRECNSISTMGVSVIGSSIALFYNKDYVNKLSDEELRYVLKHEIYHIVLHHCTHRQSEDPREKDMDNIAADLAINSLIIKTSSIMPPKNGTYAKEYGFEEKLSREQYLTLLRDKAEEENKQKNKSGNGQGGGQGDDQSDDQSDGQGSDQGSDQGSGKSSGYGDGKGNSFDDHGNWQESSIADEIIRNKVLQISKTKGAWGNMPGDVQALIMAAQTSQISWQRYLKLYLGLLISSQTTSTFKRPNRRYGYPYSGTKRKHLDKKLVAIDTSGSMSDEDLAQILAEINRLQEIYPVDLILFDHDIQLGPIDYSRKHVSFDFVGRGGTSFQPVFDIAEEKRYSTVIVLTDGFAPPPREPVGIKDTIWVITEDGEMPVDWGKCVKIVNKAA